MAFVLFAFAGALAQQAFEKTIKLKQEEVPVSVVAAFQKDFGSISGELTKGYWSAFVSEEPGGRIKPISYSYKAKKGDTRFEAKYSPEGNLESAKGADKANHSGEK